MKSSMPSMSCVAASFFGLFSFLCAGVRAIICVGCCVCVCVQSRHRTPQVTRAYFIFGVLSLYLFDVVFAVSCCYCLLIDLLFAK